MFGPKFYKENFSTTIIFTIAFQKFPWYNIFFPTTTTTTATKIIEKWVILLLLLLLFAPSEGLASSETILFAASVRVVSYLARNTASAFFSFLSFFLYKS